MKRERNEIKPRLMGVTDMMSYLNLGRTKTIEIGERAKACKRIGNKIIFDVVAIDKYIDSMMSEV